MNTKFKAKTDACVGKSTIFAAETLSFMFDCLIGPKYVPYI